MTKTKIPNPYKHSHVFSDETHSSISLTHSSFIYRLVDDLFEVFFINRKKIVKSPNIKVYNFYKTKVLGETIEYHD
jgi:hypothetical protein